MTLWYYVDRDQKRQGPLTAEALGVAYQLGQLAEDGLVWREGLAEWSAVAQFRDELGLLPLAGPPGLGTRPVPAAAPPRKTRGCLGVGAVLAAIGLVGVLGVVLLVAIALPARQDSAAHATLGSLLLPLRTHQLAVTEFRLATDRCPRDAQELALGSRLPAGLAAIEVGALADGRCTIEVRLDAVPSHPALTGARVVLVQEADGAWRCRSEDLVQADLPEGCR